MASCRVGFTERANPSVKGTACAYAQSAPLRRTLGELLRLMQVAQWQGLPVAISARLVPRFAWQTASIDVTVGDHPPVRTGGVFKATGVHEELVSAAPDAPVVLVSWGKASLRSFPVKVAVNDELVYEGRVRTQNWWCGCWPWGLILLVVLWRGFA